jgi:hypothetical protein
MIAFAALLIKEYCLRWHAVYTIRCLSACGLIISCWAAALGDHRAVKGC